MDREFIEVINQNNEKEKIEIFAQVKSEKDNKLYVLLTPDKEINDELDIAIATIEEKENELLNDKTSAMSFEQYANSKYAIENIDISLSYEENYREIKKK